MMGLKKTDSREWSMALSFMTWVAFTAGIMVKAGRRQASLENEKEDLENTVTVKGWEIKRLKKENAALRAKNIELKQVNSLLRAAASALNNQKNERRSQNEETT